MCLSGGKDPQKPSECGAKTPCKDKTEDAKQLVEKMIADGTLTISGTGDYVDAVTRDLGTIASTETGRKLLDSIAASGKPVVIRDWEPNKPGNSCRADSSAAFPKPHGSGKGTGSTVFYNPAQKGRPDGSPPIVGLNHELGHAAHNARGENARHTPFDDPTTAPSPSNMEEKNTIQNWDNPFREEMGLPQRKGHGHLP